jgi:HAD domain in Swiss Army Knife RNA repair proteins
MRPWLLIDIDGVLNLDPPREGEPSAPTSRSHRVDGGELWLDDRLSAWLQRLSERYEPVWCTTWEERANELLSPLLELPVLPVIEMAPLVVCANAHWKRPAVERWLRINPRPAVWLDDEFAGGDEAWGERLGCKIVRCDPYLGLTESVVDELLRWADEHRDDR